MKTILAIMLAVVFVLGFAGLSFSEGMKCADHGKHAAQKECCDTNCCGHQAESATKSSQSKNHEGQDWRIETLRPSEG